MTQFKIDQCIDSMSLEQKVGQTLVIGFTGTMITPTILERIKRIQPAGIRAGLTFRSKTAYHDPYATSEEFVHRVLRAPTGTVKDLVRGLPVPQCTAAEYCEFLNILKRAAWETYGLPLHITLDMEGDGSCDFPFDSIRTFPSCMGLARQGDRSMAHAAAWATAAQVVPMGFNWIHSPVLDVNTAPLNPEIGTRSYSEDPAVCGRMSIELLKAFKEIGLIATGKHFPGRGESVGDAHHQLPAIDLSRADMEVHLRPFREACESGLLPSIMSAHTAYPALDPSGRAASLSKPILTGIIREQWGYEGVITTDDITMGGIIEKFEVVDACIESINAGNDLILFRDESTLIDEVFPQLVTAVKDGRISEARIDDAVRRTLSVKSEFNLFENGNLRGPAEAGRGIRDPKVHQIAWDTAKHALELVRDDAGLLPLKPETKVLLVEQINPLHKLMNNHRCHPGILWENMLRHSDHVAMVETELVFTEDDRERVRRRLEEADVVVATNYYYRRGTGGNDFIEELNQAGKPVIVVTNTPQPLTVTPGYKTVIVTYNASPESMALTADMLYGK